MFELFTMLILYLVALKIKCTRIIQQYFNRINLITDTKICFVKNGAEINDKAAICTKCGCYTDNHQATTQEIINTLTAQKILR